MDEGSGSLLNGNEVSLATPGDSDRVIRLLKDVADWLQDKKIDQWGFLASGGEDAEIRQAIEQAQTFVVRRRGKLVGTFTLYQEPSAWDRHTWGERDDAAVYLHRLALARSEIGSGLGTLALQWIIAHLTNEGKSALRLDCVESNPKLISFYLANGFERVGTVDGHSLYQLGL